MKKINILKNRYFIWIIIFWISIFLISFFIKIKLEISVSDIINWFIWLIVVSYIWEEIYKNRSNKWILLDKINNISSIIELVIKKVQNIDNNIIDEKDRIWLFFNLQLIENKLKYILDNCNNYITDNEKNLIIKEYSNFREAITNDLLSKNLNLPLYKQQAYIKYFTFESKINELDLKIGN